MEQMGFTTEDESAHLRALSKSGSLTRWRRASFKYGPFVIVAETIVILILLSYFIYITTDNDKPSSGIGGTDSLQPLLSSSIYTPSQLAQDLKRPYSNNYTVYHDPNSKFASVRVLKNLIRGCYLRKHDFKFGVACHSREISKCSDYPSLKVDSHDSSYLERSMINNGEINELLMATQITSSKAGHRFHTKFVEMKSVECGPSCSLKTKLKFRLDKPRGQRILGFGGALTDSSINNILSLTVNGTKQLLEDYFGEKGLKYNMIRITMGGSDFSGRFYTNQDLDENALPKNQQQQRQQQPSEDFNLEHFKFREEDILYKIPILKDIQASFNQSNVKVFASMWTPPLWMKNNQHHNKGRIIGKLSNDINVKLSSESYYLTLAKHKEKFLNSYIEEGVHLWGLTVVNEPVMAQAPFLDFNSIIFDKQEYGNYVAKYLGPIIRGNKLLKDLKLIVHDDNRIFLENFTMPILRRPEVRQFIDGVATHGYIDESYYAIDEVYKEHNNINNNSNSEFFILPDELCSGHLPFMEKALIGNWDRAIHYGLDIIRSLQNSGSGWIDWNMALDIEGGPGWFNGRVDSPIIVDKAQDGYYKNPMYYALGQFSRYIPRDSRRLEMELENDIYDYHLETVAFITPGEQDIILVVLNNNPYTVDILLSGKVDKQSFNQITCNPDSISTFIISIKSFS